MTGLFPVLSLVSTVTLQAQDNHARDNKPGISAGIEYAISTYAGAGKMDITGQGVFLQGEKPFGGRANPASPVRFSGNLNLGWLYFSGTVTNFDGSTQNRFSVLPCMAGVRCYWKDRYYLGIQAGALISTGTNTATRLALAPSLGMIAPVGGSRLELGIQFTGVPMGYGTPEKSILQKGGYSFLSLRVAYDF